MRTIQRDIVGAFIISADGKLLLGKAGVYADKWVIPGGGIDEGETERQALDREVREETGIDVSQADVERIDIDLTGSSEKTLRDTGERVFVEMTFFNYLVHLPEYADQIKLTTEDDFIDARWVPIADLPAMPISAPTATTLRKLGYLPQPAGTTAED